MAWAGWVFDFYDLILYSFLLIPLGQELALSRVQVSLVFGASLAATAAGGILFGFLADRYGRKPALQWTILVFSAGTLASGLAPDLPVLLVCRVLTGIGVGGEWATGQTYVGETFPARVRGRYGAYVQTGAPIGVALASVVGGYLAPAIGWRACFILSGLPALLVVAVRRGLPESDVWLAHHEQAQRSPKGWRGARLPLTARDAGVAKSTGSRRAEERSESRDRTREGLRGIFLRCTILTIFAMSAYWFTYSWLPGYLYEQRHFSMAKSAGWILVAQAGSFLGYASFGFAADRFGRRPAFTIYSVVFAAGLAMTTVFWDLVAAHPSVILGFLFLVGVGTGVWGGFGPLFSEVFPTAVRSTAMGAAYNIARGIQFVTPVVVALMASRYGLAGGMSLAAVFALATGAWIWTFDETKGMEIA
jgi:MFS family permease